MPRALPPVALTARPAGAPLLPNVQLFTASGTFTVPRGVTLVYVSGCGGGGGGGASSDPGNYPGGGGGGAACVRTPVTVTPSASVTVTIGAAGTAGNESAGGAGGATSFGSAISLPGGLGGEIATPSGAGGLGGAYSRANMGQPFAHPFLSESSAKGLAAVLSAGSSLVFCGQDGFAGSTGSTLVGNGGASLFSAAPGGPVLALNTTEGTNPLGYGAGGAGKRTLSGNSSNPGRSGFLLVEW